MPEFTSQQNSNHFAFEDGEIVQEKITFFDGDDNLERYEIIGKPDWLLLDDSNFSSGELFLTGTPEVEDESNSTVEISIFDSQNNMSSISFVVEVYVNNYPPEIIMLNQVSSIDEDSGRTQICVFRVDDEDQTSGHNWIIGEPSNGEVNFIENADGSFVLEYQPDRDFFGTDNISLRVEDFGTDSGAPKNDEILISTTVNPIEDVPYFSSIPPKQVYEDEDFMYSIVAMDGDMPNDELFKKVQDLPSWAQLIDLGGGNALMSGIFNKRRRFPPNRSKS